MLPSSLPYMYTFLYRHVQVIWRDASDCVCAVSSAINIHSDRSKGSFLTACSQTPSLCRMSFWLLLSCCSRCESCYKCSSPSAGVNSPCENWLLQPALFFYFLLATVENFKIHHIWNIIIIISHDFIARKQLVWSWGWGLPVVKFARNWNWIQCQKQI